MTEKLIALVHISDNPYQPRVTDDAEHIEKLARSIAADGLLQKPTARHFGGNGNHQLAFGHSRFKAFEWLKVNWKAQSLTDRYNGYTSMPVEVAELSDEEMYRCAVTENVQRKDLAPTDLAKAMQRYMTEFKATSKQAADLFGVNDATVRGMVRLLDLPAVVQEKLDDGTITQSTARLFHSIQKIAPQAAIISTLKKIEQQADKRMPDQVIEEMVEHLDNVQELWDERQRDGKPRAGYHGWLLDMKNFPNQFLPAMNEQMVAANEQNIEHLVNPPACNTCPFYTKIRGSYFCGLKLCFQRKSLAWQLSMLNEASKQTKIAIYDKEDGPYKILDSYGRDEQLFTKRDKGLRLVPAHALNRNVYQGFKGLDDDLVVVIATGDALTKLHNAGSTPKGGKKSEQEKAEMRMMKIYRARRKELIWMFAGIAQSVFASAPLGLLEELEGQVKYIGVDDRIPDEWEPEEKAKAGVKAEHYRKLMVYTLTIEDSSHYHRESMADVLAGLQEHAKLWGVKIPKALIKQAEEWDAEIETVGSVSVATAKGK